MRLPHLLVPGLLILSSTHVLAADAYPYAGVYSALEVDGEQRYEMTKFLCLASFNVQHADGSYTAYHIDTRALGRDIVEYHPMETGTCDYDASKKTEHCVVAKSNWGEYDYYIEHRGPTNDGAELQASVDMRNPGVVTMTNLRACPFSESEIKPHLSDEWQNLSDDDIGWVLYRHFPFNPEQAAVVRQILGLKAK